jgi:hypothetical protein
MGVTELSAICGSLLSLALGVLLVFAVWPEQRVDVFRQDMFTLRDELFDFAADGNVSFEEPAYLLLRELMNGFIRYAHNLTPYRTLMSFLRWKCFSGEPTSASAENLNKAIGEVADTVVREKLQNFHSRAAALVMSQLVLSPVFLVLSVPLVIVTAIFYAQWSNLRAIYNSFSDRFPMGFLEGEASKH